mgnify:CR=1 FL=1
MAEMNIKQIIDRLNAEFTGDTRKLVFWYDDNGEFVEDMQTVTLDNAKVYFLQPDNQFATKLFLERQDTTTNYLVYAPFPKPDVRDNHLEDTMLYSKRFFADRASLLSVDLGIDEKYKPIIEKHIKYFASKERTQRFYTPSTCAPPWAMIWRLRTSTRKTSSPAFCRLFAAPGLAPLRK